MTTAPAFFQGTPEGSNTFAFTFKHRWWSGLEVAIGGTLVLAPFVLSIRAISPSFRDYEAFLVGLAGILAVPVWTINRFIMVKNDFLVIEKKFVEPKPDFFSGQFYLLPQGWSKPLEVTQEMFFAVDVGEKVRVRRGVLLLTVQELTVYKNTSRLELSTTDMVAKTEELVQLAQEENRRQTRKRISTSLKMFLIVLAVLIWGMAMNSVFK